MKVAALKNAANFGPFNVQLEGVKFPVVENVSIEYKNNK